MDAFEALFSDPRVPVRETYSRNEESGLRWRVELVYRLTDMTKGAFLKAAVDSGRFRFKSLETTLPSGREFRHDMQEISFPVDATPAEAEDLAEQIIKAKYRYSKWDRNHPKTNAEVEIFDFIRSWVLQRVAEVREMQARNSSSSE